MTVSLQAALSLCIKVEISPSQSAGNNHLLLSPSPQPGPAQGFLSPLRPPFPWAYHMPPPSAVRSHFPGWPLPLSLLAALPPVSRGAFPGLFSSWPLQSVLPLPPYTVCAHLPGLQEGQGALPLQEPTLLARVPARFLSRRPWKNSKNHPFCQGLGCHQRARPFSSEAGAPGTLRQEPAPLDIP